MSANGEHDPFLITTPKGEQKSAKPGSLRWYTIMKDLLTDPDEQVRVAATAHLIDVVSNGKAAEQNLNNGAWLLSLYERIIREQSAPVVAGAAQWAGLFALRTQLSEQPPRYNLVKRSAVLVGESRLPMQGWHYNTNVARAENVEKDLWTYPDERVVAATTASVQFWLAQEQQPAELQWP